MREARMPVLMGWVFILEVLDMSRCRCIQVQASREMIVEVYLDHSDTLRS